MITSKWCVELHCDSCDDPADYWSDGVWHFPDEAAALAYAKRNDWVIGTQHLCPACAAKAACALAGHQWGRWREMTKPVEHRYRMCDHCDERGHDPPWDALMALVEAAKIVDGTPR